MGLKNGGNSRQGVSCSFTRCVQRVSGGFLFNLWPAGSPLAISGGGSRQAFSCGQAPDGGPFCPRSGVASSTALSCPRPGEGSRYAPSRCKRAGGASWSEQRGFLARAAHALGRCPRSTAADACVAGRVDSEHGTEWHSESASEAHPFITDTRLSFGPPPFHPESPPSS